MFGSGANLAVTKGRHLPPASADVILGIGQDEALRLSGITVERVDLAEGGDLSKVRTEVFLAEIERLLAVYACALRAASS